MRSVAERVTVVFVHYNTPDLLETAVRSFKSFYRDVPVIIFDNGSGQASVELINVLVSEYMPFLQAFFSERNINHGPAMHRVTKLARSEFLFFIDTDTKTQRGGFLEAMCKIFDKSERIYGVGVIGIVNRRGFRAREGTQNLAPQMMMIRVGDYHLFSPFEHHGNPTFQHFRAAVANGFELADFPIHEYIQHYGSGTAGRYGYGLGLKSKANFLLNKLGL
jgi:glycosyltransferase involved in cell wall biosynthesis